MYIFYICALALLVKRRNNKHTHQTVTVTT